MRGLILNPNTSQIATARLCGHLRPRVPRWLLTLATAAFGSSSISSEVGYAIAAQAVLDASAHAPNARDLILVGCFGNPAPDFSREPGAELLADFDYADYMGPLIALRERLT